MAECKYDWPPAGQRQLIGKSISRIDGPAKSSGRAMYSYDVNLPGMLYGKSVCCPYAHARVKSIDTSEAEKLPGVKGIVIVQKPGAEIQWAGDEIVELAAVSQEVAEDAAGKVKIEYEQLPFLVNEADLDVAKRAGR